jgi:hypothetical protein
MRLRRIAANQSGGDGGRGGATYEKKREAESRPAMTPRN